MSHEILQLQVSWGPALYRLAKALWFKSLEPDIGPSQAEVVEEEEYDEYDEGLHYEEEEVEVQLLETFNHTLRSKHDYLDSSIKRLQSYYLDMIR